MAKVIFRDSPDSVIIAITSGRVSQNLDKCSGFHVSQEILSCLGSFLFQFLFFSLFHVVFSFFSFVVSTSFGSVCVKSQVTQNTQMPQNLKKCDISWWKFSFLFFFIFPFYNIISSFSFSEGYEFLRTKNSQHVSFHWCQADHAKLPRSACSGL